MNITNFLKLNLRKLKNYFCATQFSNVNLKNNLIETKKKWKGEKCLFYFMLFSLFKTELFFSIYSIFGLKHNGSDSSQFYLFAMIIIGLINIIVGLVSIFGDIKTNIHKLIVVVGIPLLFFLGLLMAVLKNNQAISIQLQYFKLFLGFSVPAFFIGSYFVEKEIDIFPVLQITMLIITVGAIASILCPFIRGEKFVSFAGGSYQSASYYSAFSFGLNIYTLLNKEKHKTTIKISSVLQVILLFLQMLMVFLPGGRGGFVLLNVYAVLGLILVNREKSVTQVIFQSIGLIALYIATIILIKSLLSSPFYTYRFDRVFSYLQVNSATKTSLENSGLINWGGTSGRLPIYLEALDFIKLSPIFGHGLYGYLCGVSYRCYPHNILLEFLLQGGIFYLFLWIVVAVFIIWKFIILIKSDADNIYFLFLFAYPIVFLMFSGTYTTDGIFWFTVTALLLKRIKCKSTSV